jgi:outer membrane cobalamin receptor
MTTNNITFAQSYITFSGRVASTDNVPLGNVIILQKGTYTRTVSNKQGKFLVRVPAKSLPATVVVRCVGYITQELQLTTDKTEAIYIRLTPDQLQINGVASVASRSEEHILQTPATIEKITNSDLQQATTTEVFRGLAHRKGIDISSTSLLNTSIATRGFNSPRADRIVALIDYMDTQSPSLSLNIGNVLGAPEIDIQSIELMHGPASVLYGKNAINGVLLTHTKDPFENEGLSLMVKGGNRNFLDVQLRFAQRINNFFAWKLSAEILSANDFVGENYDATSKNIDPANNPKNSPLGYDALNTYGDVAHNIPNVGRVYLPGFTETQLLGKDNNAKLYRINPQVVYLINSRTKFMADFKASLHNSTFQGASRYKFKNIATYQYRTELRNDDRWFVRLYRTQDAGNQSYDLGFLGNYINTTEVPGLKAFGGTPQERPVRNYAELYYTTYETTYQQAISGGATQAAAQATAQAAAAATTPRGTAFDALRSTIAQSDVPASGARLSAASALNDLSAQYTLPLKKTRIVLGGAARVYQLGSGGVLYADTASKRIINYDYGTYMHATQYLYKNFVRIDAALRFDGFKNFTPAYSSKISAVFSLNKPKTQNLRFLYSTGYRSPSNLEQYALLDIGRAVVLGNVTNGYEGYTTDVLTPSTVTTILQNAAQGITTDLSIYKTKINPLQLEKVKTVEIGYTASINNIFSLDLAYYNNSFTNLIGTRTLIANTDGTPTDPVKMAQQAATNQITQPNSPIRAIQTYENASQLINAHGVVVGVECYVAAPLVIKANYTFNEIVNEIDFADGFQSYYNTPKYKYNIGIMGSVSNTKNLNYAVNLRHTQAFEYASAFAVGNIAAQNIVDASIAYNVAKINTTFRLCGENLTNSSNVQVYGSPSMGMMLNLGVLINIQ